MISEPIMKNLSVIPILLFLFCSAGIYARNPVPQKPRVLISTDIGGTDADDNQSMTHLLMMNEQFDIEGLVSSPSFGNGSKEEILRMIDLYALDYPTLRARCPRLLAPDSLRKLCKQGRRGGAPWQGFDAPTEGSKWIAECARRDSGRPLWILAWGALEDIAQALHDAPDIVDKIRVYWIGGPNKKWGCNAYAYIASNFPDLWMIENNASYRGFIADNKDSGEWQAGYYGKHIAEAGHLGKDFINYYHGVVKMGDTPALLYMMDGDPDDPARPNWGGRFRPMKSSPYRIFQGVTDSTDTIPVYGIMELRFALPEAAKTGGRPDIPFKLLIDKQEWNGAYLDDYAAVRYSPKAPATLGYVIISDIPELNGIEGAITASGLWPGTTEAASDIALGERWFTDIPDPNAFSGQWQGCRTVGQWREEALRDWADRWEWLKKASGR